jgi:hypothetical protein
VYNQCSDQWRHCQQTGRLVIDNININAVLDNMQMALDDRAYLFDEVKCIACEIAATIAASTTTDTTQTTTTRNQRGDLKSHGPTQN